MENEYIQGRIDVLQAHYNSKSRNEQIEMVRQYHGDCVSDILGKQSGRQFCQEYALTLMEESGLKIGSLIFEEIFEVLVDEIEEFFIKRKRRVDSQFHRNVTAFLMKKSRESPRNS